MKEFVVCIIENKMLYSSQCLVIKVRVPAYNLKKIE